MSNNFDNSSSRQQRGNIRTVHDISTTSNLFSSVIMSVVEGRGKAKGEIGLAYIDLNSPILHLVQFRDNCSFDSLKMKCHVCQPVQIIYPNTLTQNNMMMSSLVESFPDTNFCPFDRRFFNEKRGLEFVKTLCYKDYTGIDIELESKYYCLSACSALLQYVYLEKKIKYASKTVKIVYESSCNTMIIDPTSAKVLELLINLSDPKSNDTLFGAINRTKTKSGYPSTDLCLINNRLDMVEAVSSSMDIFNDFNVVLTSLGSVDLDQLLVHLVQDPSAANSISTRNAEKKIDLAISIKHVVSLVDQLRTTLQECNHLLFKEYIDQLKDADFKSIQEMIDQVINCEAKFNKGNANMNLQKCFAIKDKFNPLLDLARSIYSDAIDDLIALARTYETKYNIENLSIGNSTAKGFYLQVKHSLNQPPLKLPAIFFDVSVTKNSISFTTNDVLMLNARAKKAIEEIYLQSDCIITKLINDIRTKISCFYTLTDIVANADLAFSFAYQCSCSNYIRPQFGRYTEIVNGIHPVLENMSLSVPNGVQITDDLNFHIITGPNMSGKTTFLKQTALLQIMAQIGSFVPAELATFRICDKLFTRMALNDNLQLNSSSFMVEVKELNYILNNLTKNCLILIDELGRGSVYNGTLSVCWAICESLLSSKAYTLFATHIIELTNLTKVYLNNTVCKYPHILLPGPTKERFYGIELAQMSGLDETIVEVAKAIALKLASERPSEGGEDVDGISLKRAKYRFAAKLIHLLINKQQKLDDHLIGLLRCEFEEMKQFDFSYE
ncbi:MutS protein msh4 [Tyrophagus putrescentiae]|nr:MutS protein msh4 [Tyrophagus putrescentiae]